MKRIFSSALAAGFLALGVQLAAADPVKLVFASGSPGGSPNAAFFNEWIQRVNQAGKGLVEIELRDGDTIANFSNVFDRVQSDVIQIGWMSPGVYGAKFPLTEAASLPFSSSDSVACAAAFWRVYKSGLLDQEYKDIQPLWFACADVAHMHFAKDPASVDSLAGVKMRVKTKIEGDSVQLLGGTPVSVAAGEMYAGLQRGTIDGVITGWSGFIPYKLNEVAKYHLEVPFGTAVSMHFMSRSKFDSLPKAVQDLLLSYGGEARSKEMATYLVKTAQQARDEAVSLKHTIVSLTPAQLDAWKAKTASVGADWVKTHPGGDKVVEALAKAYADVVAGR